ncbi:MAG: nrnA [Clostridiaceae bacterium]|nr:nrnA [Clostridiaceae bacterium]
MIMNDILSKIKESNRIAIAFHASPDGDSIGSSLALLQGLLSIKKDAYIICKETLPRDFAFLPFSQVIDGNTATVKEGTECVIVLDCGDVKRINGDINIGNRRYTLVNIDHHLSNEMYGDFNYVDTKAAAISEIIYSMLKALNIKITSAIAACLYTSLITDTGSFKYNNTTFNTHLVAGELINTGIDFSEIHRTIFENKPFIKLKLMGKVLDTLELENNLLCSMCVTNKIIEDLNIKYDIDSAELIAAAMEIGSIDCAVLFKETDDGYKISLRSKNIVDVSKVAESLGGGGHKRAAGAFIKDKDLNNVKEKVLNLIKNELV